MAVAEARQLVEELTESWKWLEAYVRRQSASAVAEEIALASAVLRNVVGPFLEGSPAVPLHIAVVGGAGTGKSTVVNFLLGQSLAETNPQAGYTRHPTAFVWGEVRNVWPQSPGFLGGLQPVSDPCRADVDTDIYQIRKVESSVEEPLRQCVVWDCPDITTWVAQGYIRRVWEVAGLADLILYVTSDERYNDLVPTQFLHLLVRLGKPVIAVLTKVPTEQADQLVAHFRQEVLGRLPRRADGSLPEVPVVVLPFLPGTARRDPSGAGKPYRQTLLEQVTAVIARPEQVRQHHVLYALRFMQQLVTHLQKEVQQELEEFRLWQQLVHQLRLAMERRYEAEYLEVERFQVVEDCRNAWMELLELPAAGRWLSAVMWVVRTPYRAARNYVRRRWTHAPVVVPPEEEVLREAAAAWRDTLHAETLRRVDRHPFWQDLARRFPTELLPAWEQQWHQLCPQFQQHQQQELADSCRQLLEWWQARPGRLALLRYTKLLWDGAGVAGIVYLTWPLNWYHLLLVPLSLSLTHQVAEWLGTAQIEGLRRRLRQQRSRQLREMLSGPLESWLQQWPVHAGTSLAQLQHVLEHTPAALSRLETALVDRIPPAATGLGRPSQKPPA